MTSEDLPYAAEKDGLRLAVRLTPRASRNGLDGIRHGADGRAALQLRLVAPPVEGAANKALVAYLADGLDLRKSDIRIRSGETARLKIVFIAGDAESLMARLADWVARGGG